MIKVYQCRSYNSAFKSTLAWLEEHDLAYCVLTPTGFREEDLRHILQLSYRGFEDILGFRTRAQKLYERLDLERHIEDLSVSEMIAFIMTHQEVLRSPIVFNDKHLAVGYDPAALRGFVSRRVKIRK